MALSLQCQE